MDENPSAFPSEQGHIPDGTWNLTYDPGMTLREWYAGQALAGCLASAKWDNAGIGFETYIATHAFNIADAMLAARQEPSHG